MKYEVVKQTYKAGTDEVPANMVYEVVGKNHGITSAKVMCAKYTNQWKKITYFYRAQAE